MHTSAADVRTVLAGRIQQHLLRVERKVGRLRRLNVQVVGVSLVCTTIATLLAGLTAAVGPLLGEGAPAWRWTCGIVAVVTAGAALATGLQQRFKVPEQLARSLTCAGKLHSLELALQLSRRPPEEVGQEYEQLITTYPEELI
jgi:hypothetical protein